MNEKDFAKRRKGYGEPSGCFVGVAITYSKAISNLNACNGYGNVVFPSSYEN